MHITLVCFNSLAPRRIEINCREVIFKLISVIDGLGISCEIVLTWMPQVLTDDKSTLIQVMTWCHQATSHYLSQCWPGSLSPYGVTRPQWVNKHNTPNPVCSVATICHQVCFVHWGHPSLFHTASFLLNWYKIIDMENLLYGFFKVKFTNMLSIYVKFGTHRYIQ